MIRVTKENGFEYPLGTVILDGERFDKVGFEMLQTSNAMTYSENPSRGNTGEMYLEDMDSFIVPQCSIGFTLIKIEDYIRMKHLLLTRKEHTLNYFDADFGARITHKMYVEPDKLKKFFARGNNVIGVQGYSVEFIGLLTEAERYSVSYNPNGGSKATISDFSASVTYSKGKVVNLDGVYYRYINDTAASGKVPPEPDYWEYVDMASLNGTQNLRWGEPIMIEDCTGVFIPPAGKSRFICYADAVNADGSIADTAWKYYPENSLSVFKNTTLFAIWE